jgi:hypothetical protein
LINSWFIIILVAIWLALFCTDIYAVVILNFRKNPRWGIAEPQNTIEVNQRFDWILLKNPYPNKLPELKSSTMFGTKISEETHLAASDHYGIMVEIEF